MATEFDEVRLDHIGPGLVAQIDAEVGRAIQRVREHDADKITVAFGVEVGWDKDGELACKAASKHAVTKNAVWYPPRPAQQEMDLKSEESPALDPEQPVLPAMAEYVPAAPEPLALGAGEEVIEAELVPEPDDRPFYLGCDGCSRPIEPEKLARHIFDMEDPGEGNAVFVKQEGSLVTQHSYPLPQTERDAFNRTGRGVLVTEHGLTCAACLQAEHARKGELAAA